MSGGLDFSEWNRNQENFCYRKKMYIYALHFMLIRETNLKNSSFAYILKLELKAKNKMEYKINRNNLTREFENIILMDIQYLPYFIY